MLGIFDSGVGGLTVVKELKKKFSAAGLVYFGDTARVPWGNKSPQTVRAYSCQICDFLIAKGCKKIVIACNTASAFAGEFLRKKYPEVEFIDVIEPVVKRIIEISKKEDSFVTGLIGTRATIFSCEYEKRLGTELKKNQLVSQACPLFVPLIEEDTKNEKLIVEVLKEYLTDWQGKISHLVLGCTHYPLLEKQIKNFFDGKVEIISSAREVADSLDDVDLIQGGDQYFLTDLSRHYNLFATKILKKNVNLKQASL